MCWRCKSGIGQVILAVAVVLGAVYYFADPMTVWAPKCPFKLVTGLSCPACGGQRALHALLHLRIGEALGYNLFLIAGIPYLLSAVVVKAAGAEHLPRLAKAVGSGWAVWTYVVLFFVWWVVRNVLGI